MSTERPDETIAAMLAGDPQRLQQTLTDLFTTAASSSSKCRTCQTFANAAKLVAYLRDLRLREAE